MKFMDNEHRAFFEQQTARAHAEGDTYRKAMFYALGLTDTTRRHIEEIYDFANHCPRFNVMRKAWQTSSSVQVTRLAFNLYNGYDGSGKTDPHSAYTPYELFATGFMEYMFEALRIRYPEYSEAGQAQARQFMSMF